MTLRMFMIKDPFLQYTYFSYKLHVLNIVPKQPLIFKTVIIQCRDKTMKEGWVCWKRCRIFQKFTR